MSEAFAHPEHAPTWVEAIQGNPPVWEEFLTGYAAGVREGGVHVGVALVGSGESLPSMQTAGLGPC